MKKTLVMMILVLSLLVSTGMADEASRLKTAKQIVNDYGDAIVSVSALLKAEMGGRGGEQEVEAIGTVINASGLTVASYVSLDPIGAGMFGGAMGGAMPKSSLSDVKITLADGTEIDAKLVLKDPDLDLAFIMPQKTEDAELPTFKYVPLDKSAKAEQLDAIIGLSRLDKSMDRACSVWMSRVSAVVKKPRTFYCGGAEGVGTPAFTEDGKTLGISIIRIPKTGGKGAMQGVQPVILPAEDVMEVAEQAIQAAAKQATEKTEEPAAEEAKDADSEKAVDAPEKAAEKKDE